MTAVLACKLCRALIRLLGRGGTDFPGRVALKLCPNLLGELARNVTTVIVTGTNGKTTTSRMIEQSWQDAGISYFANKSGANLLSGVTAEFAVHSTLTGRCRYSHALIESDEAALKFISKYVDAKVIVYTNVFRDQPRPLRRGHAYAQQAARRRAEQSERRSVPERGRFAHYQPARRRAEPRYFLRRQHAAL